MIDAHISSSTLLKRDTTHISLSTAVVYVLFVFLFQTNEEVKHSQRDSPYILST